MCRCKAAKEREDTNRGRPQKHAVQAPQAPPQQSTVDGTKRKRGRPRKNPVVPPNARLQNTASTPHLEEPPEIVVEDFSFPDEDTYEAPVLSKLKPPSKPNHFNSSEEHVKVLQGVSSVLISELKEASDANRMIDLSTKTFAFLDSISVDYLHLYKAVRAFIHSQCYKEALEIRKPGSAFAKQTRYHEAVSNFSNAEETQSRAHTKVRDVKHRLEEKGEELRKAKEEFAKVEAELAAAEAEEVRSDEAYSKAEAELRNVSKAMVKAKLVIEEFEKRWEYAMARIERTMDELLLLKK